MDKYLKTSLWVQFGSAIDMLNEAIVSCPEKHWTAVLWDDPEDPRYGHFWFIAYHCLSWLDLFLTSNYKDFKPPAPFVRGILPEKPYAKEDILDYLKQCRQKSQIIIEGLTDEKAQEICKFEWMELSYFELQLYSMRHIQEHSSQLRFFLGRQGIPTNDWVARLDKASS